MNLDLLNAAKHCLSMNNSGFLIYASNIDGIEPVIILLKLRQLDIYVLVYHVLVLRNG